MKLTQGVLLQSFKEEFQVDTEGKVNTPTIPGSVLVAGQPVGPSMQTYLRLEVGKLIHMAQWSRSEISHAVRDTAKHMHNATVLGIEGMHRVVEYCLNTPD